MQKSYWISNSKSKTYPKLDKNIKTECLIVGAGLTGIQTAYLLSERIKDVVVVEADRIGCGASGRNTGKITASHGLIYKKISDKYSDKIARMYYDANEEGIKFIMSIVEKYGIDCDLEILPNYIFTQDADYVEKLKEEHNKCSELGIPYEYLNEIEDFPLDIKCALKLDNQAQFNSKKYIDSLAKIDIARGVTIYEDTAVVGLEKLDGIYRVKTAGGNYIESKIIIIASQNPWYDGMRLYFSKQRAYRSYLAMANLNKPIQRGMFINVEKPTKTIRIYKEGEREYLLCGGFDHITGKCDNERAVFDEVVDFAKNNFKISDIKYKWSTQDYITTDNIAYIGRINKSEKNIYIATGFNKWGISTSAVASTIFRDLIFNGESEYEEVFNPYRIGSYIDVDYLKDNLTMGYDYIKSKFKSVSHEFDISKGEGKIVVIDKKRYGAYRDYDDKVYILDITCTHLGCELEFNSFEKSWDCPCHGSRFNFDGSILNGPALKPLKLIGMGDNDIDPDLI